MNKTYIVIVTYNGMKWLKKCLDSCQDYPVIIVDNNSTDNTINYVESNYRKIKLIKQSKNLGFGQANNLGISYALSQGAEHVFLLNQDAYLIDNCLHKLISFQTKNPDYGVLSPIHITGSKEKLDRNFSQYLNYDNNPNFYSDFVLKRELKEVYSVPFVNAASWLLSKKILLEIGGFDPLFYHYGEDDNFCQRALYHNFKIGIIPTAFIVHDREDRKTEIIKIGSDKYFASKERKYKVKYANISNNLNDNIETEFKKLKKLILKLILKGQFKRSNLVKKELKMLREIQPQILESKIINSKRGANYINY